MNAGEYLQARFNGIAGARTLHTTITNNNGRWDVDLKVLDPECPSHVIYSASGEHNTLETAITLAAQALAEKEKSYDPKQQQLSRPRHLPSGYTWAYQLVVKPIYP